MHIKLNSEQKTVGGFSTDEAIVIATSYNLNKNVMLVTGATHPMGGNSTNVNINFQVYKSEADKEGGEQPIQIAGLNPTVYTPVTSSDLTIEDIYSILIEKLESFIPQLITE